MDKKHTDRNRLIFGAEQIYQDSPRLAPKDGKADKLERDSPGIDHKEKPSRSFSQGDSSFDSESSSGYIDTKNSKQKETVEEEKKIVMATLQVELDQGTGRAS